MGQIFPNFSLFLNLRYWYRHLKKYFILNREPIRPCTSVAVEIHKGIPTAAFEKVFKVSSINIMWTKYSIKRRHYASSAQFVAIYWAYGCGSRYTGIIYEVLVSHDIIPAQAVQFCDVVVKKISLADYSKFSGVRECFDKL